MGEEREKYRAKVTLLWSAGIQDEIGGCTLSHPDVLRSVAEKVLNPCRQRAVYVQIAQLHNQFLWNCCVECGAEVDEQVSAGRCCSVPGE